MIEGSHMSAAQLVLVIATQVFLFITLVPALWFTILFSRAAPQKKWRVRLIYVWAVIGLLLALSELLVIIIGCPALPVMRILTWLDRTALCIGYLATGLTSWQLVKHYTDRTE